MATNNNTAIADVIELDSTSQKSNGVLRYKVGIDAGNRQIKACLNGKTLVMPSIISVLRQNTPLPVAQNSAAVTYTGGDCLPLKGRSWAIGQIAGEWSGQPTFKAEKADLAPQLVLATLAALLGGEGSGVVSVTELMLCLPDNDPEKFREVTLALKGMHQLELPNGGALTVHIKNIRIALECLDAYKWLLTTDAFIMPTKTTTGIVDVGGGTTIAQLFGASGSPIPDSRIVVAGAMDLAQLIAPTLKGVESKGHSPKIEWILDGIADGTYLYGSTGVSFYQDFQICHEQWYEKVRNDIRTQWRDYLAQVSQVAIVGGGATLLQPLVDSVKTKGRFFIADNAAIATVLGMGL